MGQRDGREDASSSLFLTRFQTREKESELESLSLKTLLLSNILLSS